MYALRTWMVAWLSAQNVGRSLAGELSLHALDLQLMGDYYCGQTIRYRSANQANSAFRPFGVDK